MRMLFWGLLLVAVCAGASAQGYRDLAGREGYAEVLTEEGRGMYTRLYRPAHADTVWAWIEHVGPEDPPNYDAAGHADIVIWCYPGRYPHENHALPEAKGQIRVIRDRSYIWLD